MWIIWIDFNDFIDNWKIEEEREVWGCESGGSHDSYTSRIETRIIYAIISFLSSIIFFIDEEFFYIKYIKKFFININKEQSKFLWDLCVIK